MIWEGHMLCPEFVDQNVEFMSLFITTKGYISFESHGKEIYADENYVQFFMKDQTARVIALSEDYESVGIIVSKKYWTESLMHVNPYLSISMTRPALWINTEERRTLLEFIEAVKCVKKGGFKENSLVFRSLFTGILYYVGGLYKKWAVRLSKAPDAKVLVDFTALLDKNYKAEREVTFYADHLHMSRSAFSLKVKQTIGYSAKECIERYVIVRVCADLINTDKSVKELAFDYNFNDTSHFCKFFRRIIGESPENYRKAAVGMTNG